MLQLLDGLQILCEVVQLEDNVLASFGSHLGS